MNKEIKIEITLYEEGGLRVVAPDALSSMECLAILQQAVGNMYVQACRETAFRSRIDPKKFKELSDLMLKQNKPDQN